VKEGGHLRRENRKRGGGEGVTSGLKRGHVSKHKKKSGKKTERKHQEREFFRLRGKVLKRRVRGIREEKKEVRKVQRETKRGGG